MKHPKLLAALPATALAFLLSQCVVPYESARMLPKGDVELKGAFTHARANANGESEKLDNGYGIGIGYGINEKFNMKFRYEHFTNEGSANFVSIGPKLAIVQDRIAAVLPVGLYFDEGETEWATSPMLLFTLPTASNTFEATLGIHGDKIFEEDTDWLLGFNLGLGFSKDLSRWAIRPDAGISFSPGNEGYFLTFGVAASYNIATGRSER